MASATTTETDREIARRIPGEKSTLPALALLLGWLIPGAGHLLLGKWVRALLLFVAIVGMFAIGIALMGKIYLPNTGEILDMLGFVGQLGTGILYMLARAFGWGAASAQTTLNDYGSKYLVACGLLNLIAAVDAYSLANGRKASQVDMLTQFSAALLFALCTSVVFGITQRAQPRMMMRFGAFCFVLFAGSVIVASWLFYFIKH